MSTTETGLNKQSELVTSTQSKETLENPGQLREHGSVIAGQDSVDGWQAARLL